MAGTEDIRDFNSKTGKVVTIKEQKVKTPSLPLTTSKIIFDEVGIYEFDNKKFASNLLDETESDVARGSVLEVEGKRGEVLKETGIERNFSLSILILIIVFILLIFIFEFLLILHFSFYQHHPNQ